MDLGMEPGMTPGQRIKLKVRDLYRLTGLLTLLPVAGAQTIPLPCAAGWFVRLNFLSGG
jgi:hypothetical protein